LVTGLGAKPDLRLATEAGLATADGGIAVDQFLRSGDTDIFVAGDLAAAWHPIYGRRLRVEHWDNAIEQGKLAARNILGEAVPYERRPYFYSDQFDLGMEYRGLAVDVDDVVISGDIGSREFCAFWLHEDRIVAAMNANVWDVGDQLQSLVETQPLVDRARLAREGAQMAAPVAAAAA
jgi:NADPH-dependent 2,4-dienoyl-CoA reductase/sulfur reductase-like enzyme